MRSSVVLLGRGLHGIERVALGVFWADGRALYRP